MALLWETRGELGEFIVTQSRTRTLLRRWAPLALLIPLCSSLSPLFFARIDYRFYNFFASKRPDPQWSHVAVVEIDDRTVRSVFEGAVYPLSNHADEHAELIRALRSIDVRSIVLDLRLSADDFASTPQALADAMRAAGNVYLMTALAYRGSQTSLEVGLESSPHPLLQEAARGVFVANVRVDPDGVFRRLAPIPEAFPLGLSTLPELLAGSRLDRPVPVEFPTPDAPIPSVSYADVLADAENLRDTLEGRVVFVGSVLDEGNDFLVIPRNQGWAFLLPGVHALAAATETLLDGAPLRDAGWKLSLAWIVFWSMLAVGVVRRHRPFLSVALLTLVVLVALVVTGVLHAQAGLVFPAGLLLGSLVVCGGYTLVDTHFQTTRELYSVLKRSHDELEEKVIERTAELATANAELYDALETLKATQAQLVQSEKMASLGGLVAGIAHEINNPVGAVSAALDVSRRCIEKVENELKTSNPGGADRVEKPISIMKQSCASAEEAGRRIAEIVRSLKNFARLDEADFQRADLHEGIDSTITLLDHEMDGRIRVVKDYGDLPEVRCYVRELNQVFMNVMRNAVQSIEGEGAITVTTSIDGDRALVCFADTGKGISQDALPRIFDPGFTTRGVGVGTGLGLSISYNIVKKHGGDIRVDSTAGKGTSVTVEIPIGGEGE